MIIETAASCAPGFTEYCRLFCQLRSLVAAGQDESAEGEELRDEMDFLWQRLTRADLDRLDGLAADLSHVGTERTQSGEVPDALCAEFRSLLATRDFDGALRFLRENEGRLPARDVAVLRGILWADLGQYAPAAVFMSDAIRLSPGDVRFLALYFRFLLSSGQAKLAKAEAARLTLDVADPYLLLLSADVLFDSLESIPGSGFEMELREVIQLVNRGIGSLPEAPSAPWRSAIASAAMYSKALSHELLGEEAEAMTAASEADKIAPLGRATAIASQPKASAQSNGRFREELHARRRLAHDEIVTSASPSLSAA
ncbi:MAG TPA: hypothetical protein VNH11_06220 [Pirellulales bacterium]|nr:hypothetical protein [Pirellulales bacterium]